MIRDLVARERRTERPDGDVVITRGASRENAANLAPGFLSELASRYAGTRTGRQELEGELLEDVPGALWSHALLEATRVEAAPEELERIVIGVDPAGSVSAETADETGIVAAARARDGHAYVIADYSGRYAPVEWARIVVNAFHSLRADKVVVERNFGGDMVLANIAAVDPHIPVKAITSSRSKVLRAEPVSSLFEQRKAHLVGELEGLSDQLASFTSDWDRSRGSPDRVDAMVFALSELTLGRPIGGYFDERALLADGEPVAMPQYTDLTFAVVSASDQGDVIATVYFGYSRHPRGLWLLDWDLARFEAGIFEGWLPQTIDRLKALAVQCVADAADVALWVEREGVGAAILQQGAQRGLPLYDICERLALPRELSERVSDVSGWIHSGAVKIVRAAHEKIVAFDGITRNHFLAQYTGFRLGAAAGEAAERGELLSALCAGLVLATPEEVRRKRRKHA